MKKLKPIYTPDYRSPPSGTGTITFQDGSVILIQDAGCNPTVAAGYYDCIITIPHDSGEEYEKHRHALIKILRALGVGVVYDYELIYNLEDFESELNAEDGYMTLNEFSMLTKGLGWMKVLKIKSKDNKTIYGRNDENYFYKKLKLNTSIDYINNLNNHLISTY